MSPISARRRQRQQLLDRTGLVRGQAFEHVFQIGVGIEPIEARALDQRLNGGCALASPLGARKQPVFALM